MGSSGKGGHKRPKGTNDYDPETGLTPIRIRYAQFRASGKSYAASWREAGYKCEDNTGKPTTETKICEQAKRLEKRFPQIAKLIVDLQEQIANETLDTAIAARTLIRLRDTADAREISGNRIGCCRYCWGDDNRYQRTVMEMQRDRETHENHLNTLLESSDEKDQEKARRIGPFDEKGGIGYNENNKPSPDCGECFGKGVNRPYIADTDSLSPAAAAIFKGIKQKADGSIEAIVDREGAPGHRAKLHGLLVDKVVNSYDLSNLSDEDLEKLEQIQSKIVKK